MESSDKSTLSDNKNDSQAIIKQLNSIENFRVQSVYIREWTSVKSEPGEFAILTYNILADVALNHFYRHLPINLRCHPHRWLRITSELLNYGLPDIVLLQVGNSITLN